MRLYKPGVYAAQFIGQHAVRLLFSTRNLGTSSLPLSGRIDQPFRWIRWLYFS